MSRYERLFEPVKIGPVTAPNRFYAVPHATGHGWSNPNGSIALRAMKAEGGWGVVCSQMTEIAADSDLASHPMDRLWDDRDISAHQAQVEAVKSHGALAAIELAHGGMRARNFCTGLPVSGPSHLPILRPEVPIQAKAMTLADIAKFRQSHKAAARRAIKAGFDILYVYAAHDLSLLSHFLSKRTNQRSDNYGGSLENRLRLLREVLEDTLEVADGSAAVALRFSVSEPDKSIGLTHDGEGREVVAALAELPDLWDVNISGWPQDSATSRFSEEGYQLEFTDFVKTLTSKPVVGVGRFTSPDLMLSLVKKGRLDFIGCARASIADPFLPNKIRADQTDEIRECIGCNICVSMDGYGVPIRCTQNPTISEEWRRDWHPESIPKTNSANTQSHLIVGAGPAGLECAWTLLRAGHKVTIAEAEPVAGGRVSRESRLPGLNAWSRVRDYRLQQINRSNNANLYLSSQLGLEDIKSFDADTVIFATGARWRADGVGSSNFETIEFRSIPVFTPDDLMDGKLPGNEYKHVVVYDDDHYYMASVLAEKLALQSCKVTYITPQAMVSAWTDFTLEQERIIERMNKLGINMRVNLSLTSDASFNCTLTGQSTQINFDALVFVGARMPSNTLFEQANSEQSMNNIRCIGDCQSPGIIQAAVLSGHSAAREIMAVANNNNDCSQEFDFKRETLSSLVNN